MGKFQLSKAAAQSAIYYSTETREKLLNNIKIMDNNVYSLFATLKDPTLKKYVELSTQVDKLLIQITQRLDDISSYCRQVITWIDKYNEL